MIVKATMQCGLDYPKSYWKLNMACLRNLALIQELKCEIKKILQLRVLVSSEIELWDLLKSRLKDFFKFKCRELNHAKNMKYNEDVKAYKSKV